MRTYQLKVLDGSTEAAVTGRLRQLQAPLPLRFAPEFDENLCALIQCVCGNRVSRSRAGELAGDFALSGRGRRVA